MSDHEHDHQESFRPEPVLAAIDAATERLLGTADTLDDAGVRAPSLLPGWSRGHVLTHLARNADSTRNLLRWARTGAETPDYASAEARAADIEAGAGRPAAALVADVRDSAARLAADLARMPPQAWEHPVRWTIGGPGPVRRGVPARLQEVLIHHVDLDAGYTPADWPGDFVGDLLGRVVRSFSVRENVPSMRLHTEDTGQRHHIGSSGDDAVQISGPAHAILAWLIGRSHGGDLSTAGRRPLPAVPPLF